MQRRDPQFPGLVVFGKRRELRHGPYLQRGIIQQHLHPGVDTAFHTDPAATFFIYHTQQPRLLLREMLQVTRQPSPAHRHLPEPRPVMGWQGRAGFLGRQQLQARPFAFAQPLDMAQRALTRFLHLFVQPRIPPRGDRGRHSGRRSRLCAR